MSDLQNMTARFVMKSITSNLERESQDCMLSALHYFPSSQREYDIAV